MYESLRRQIQGRKNMHKLQNELPLDLGLGYDNWELEQRSPYDSVEDESRVSAFWICPREVFACGIRTRTTTQLEHGSGEQDRS